DGTCRADRGHSAVRPRGRLRSSQLLRRGGRSSRCVGCTVGSPGRRRDRTGEAEESVLSRAAALGWDPAAKATVLVGNPPPDDPPAIVHRVRSRAARIGRPVLLDVQGSRLVIVIAGPTDGSSGNNDVLTDLASAFADGPIVAGPTVSSLAEAHRSAAEALSGLRAVAGRPSAPRPTRSVDLLPERALVGDPEAERVLVDDISTPLEDAAPALLETVE